VGALCKVKQAGLTRHIGVSNFSIALIEEAVALSSEPLVCNQIEMHPYLDQSKVIAACRAHGIAVVAHSPLAKAKIRNDPVLARIGQAHGKSGVQVGLRFLVQQGIPAIPRTSRLERLEENLALFDFVLSEAEMADIAALAHRGGRLIDYAFSGSPRWD
jgi:2,5-diketo-D-gluconate reductase B